MHNQRSCMLKPLGIGKPRGSVIIPGVFIWPKEKRPSIATGALSIKGN